MKTHCTNLERRLKVFEDKAAEKTLKKAEEERKRQEEEEEKQRIEEQKRKEEEAKKDKFNQMFSDSRQINQQQMATLRGFLEQYRG